MATQADYSAAANAILAVLDAWIRANIPDEFQNEAIAEMPALAGACAKAGVDAVDAERGPNVQ